MATDPNTIVQQAVDTAIGEREEIGQAVRKALGVAE